ncbi:MAG TPA: TonB-dependent receptor [Steroidobacteraceae bacterium]|nr:TonB-dependent receptor [Steroidobacteraceae bacterium]
MFMFPFRSAAPRAVTVIALMGLVPAANADTADSPDSPDMSVLPPVVVTAQHLDESRSKIQTQTGASTYTLDAAAIAAIPGGDNTLLNQVILQAPEVAQDSFGQFHIRGEHNGLQYRINGIILPEGIAVFGQSLDPRLISSLSLVTGALPAEFGLRTAGIIDIKTKSGILAQGGDVAVYGGSHGEVEPSFVYGGGSGSFSYFVSGDFLRSDLGIESPDGSVNPIHDHTTQYHGFGYFEDILDEENRVALMLGSSVGQFQIPNLVGAQALYAADGISNFLSQNLNENQREVTQFGAVSWQHSAGAFNMQTSFVARYSSLTFDPDQIGDIIFSGIAQDAYKQNVAYAAQSDGSYQLNDEHTVRAGLFLQSDHSISETNSFVLDTNNVGIPLNDTPVSIVDNGGKTEWIESAYLQDEWKMQENFTVNYGVRLDRFTAYTSAGQASPRLNAVWQVARDTTLHLGYSRYLSPPPFELVGGKDIGLFLNTTNPPLTPQATSPLAERANYYDFGVQQKFTAALTMGLDFYYKQSVNLIDEGQFGAPIILTPFNYRFGKQEGVEWTTTYTSGGLSAYFNAAAQSARGKQIDSAQFNFSPTDLAYIAQNDIHLDHEQEFTGSGGVSYSWNDTRVSADFLEGSGLRANLELPAGQSNGSGGTAIPNGEHLPYYAQVNAGLTHIFRIAGAGTLTARFDVINVFDKEYQIRNGTGVGVGAPQYGPRRGFFIGLTKSLGSAM